MTTKRRHDDRSPSQKLSDRALAPLVKKSGEWGYTVRLLKHLRKRLGRNIHRNAVDSWLHSDVTKRVRPDYGTVILLLLAAEDTDAELKRHESKTR